MPTRTPTQLEALDKWRESILRDLRVALPARVEKYDPSTQLADLKPLIQDFFYDEDDSTTSISIPVVPSVPVQWLGGGGFSVTAPLAVGDIVTLLVCDRSIDAWLAQGGEQTPLDERRHNLSDAVALVGLHDNQHAIQGVPTDGIAMGANGGMRVKVTTTAVQLGQNPTQAAVNGNTFMSGLDTMLTAIGTYLTALGAATGTVAGATTANAAITTFKALTRLSGTVTLQP